jgi:hypothetical protein
VSSHNEITTLPEEYKNRNGETKERNIIMIKVTLFKNEPENAKQLVGY